MIKLIIQRNRIGPVRGRHPWVFQGAIKHVPEGLSSGMPVALYDELGNFLAQGYFNSYSQMAVRVWSWDAKEEPDDEFFAKRILSARNLRQEYLASKETDSYRLINSENDLLPGLIVDKYGDYLCVQFHNRGINFWRDKIITALKTIIKPKGIYERSDVGGRKEDPANLSFPRKRESNGESGHTGLLYGEVPEKIKITENGYKFWVDLAHGQKTGFFMDQRDKRLALQKYVKGKNVLNCFSYSGGFSVYALGAGAARVVSVDSSAEAMELCKENIKLNKLDIKKCEFVVDDVKNYLSKLGALSESKTIREESPESFFDVIILDPPAFVKDRRKINEGLMGYKKINEMALRALPENGILVTASCSTHVTMQDFRYAVSESAGRAHRTVQIVESFTHGLDHPELVSFVEGEYLKCLFARAI